MRPRFYVDMDGVIADFVAGMERDGFSDPDEYKMIPCVYEGLPIYPGAEEALKRLEELGDVMIATKIPSENSFAASEKLRWIERYFPRFIKKVIITHDKGCLGGVGDFLIDDRLHKANCEAFRGEKILFVSWEDAMEKIDSFLSIR